MPIFTQNFGVVGIFATDFGLPDAAALSESVGADGLRQGAGHPASEEWLFANGVVIRKEARSADTHRLEVQAPPSADLSYRTVRRVFLKVLPSASHQVTSVGVNSISLLLNSGSHILEQFTSSLRGNNLLRSETQLAGVHLRTPWVGGTMNLKLTEQKLAPAQGESSAYIIDTNFDFSTNFRKDVRRVLSLSNLEEIESEIERIFRRVEEDAR